MAQAKDKPLAPSEKLFQIMSEVISLREQVAQAELAKGRLGSALEQRPSGSHPSN
jgi:hypothetical protein